MLEDVVDAVEYWLDHPWEFVGDVLALVCLCGLSVGMLFLPLIFGG